MSDEIKYTLNVQSVDNPLTKEAGDKRFVVNPGLERETVEAVIKLEHRIIQRLTLSGMRVSNGLFSAVASPKGRAGASWDPAVNQLNITIAQGADWREAIRNTTVNVLGEKAEVMYVNHRRRHPRHRPHRHPGLPLHRGGQLPEAGGRRPVGRHHPRR